MFKKALIVMLLLIGGMKAKAQYLHYNGSSNQNNQDETQIVTAYSVDASTNTVQRVKLKIQTVDGTVKIVGVKELRSEYWTDLSLPLSAEKIRYSTDEFEKQYEYKVYIAILGREVYF